MGGFGLMPFRRRFKTRQLGVTGLLLFVKISRAIRVRRDYKRFLEWNAQEHGGKHPKSRVKGKNRTKGKNAFDIVEEDEGIPG